MTHATTRDRDRHTAGHLPQDFFCNQVHFFVSTDATKDWLREHPDARVLLLADAFEAGRPIVEQILSGAAPNACC
ncbi:organomercurial lyase [Streptomyces cellulosae]|uniref:organomercurial lyase n=1 Tax=Streptomyces TaxID=1883 RepID=UPI0022504EDD|nr:organomercurial lyase [Streptomyces sp. OS603R]MCX4481579.1 organomercurial lyase [Streptomyces cellulosae]WTC54935.1 organomercurial lyase [Streptomyces cellulosae]